MDGTWMLRDRHVYRPACRSGIRLLVFRFGSVSAKQPTDQPPDGDIDLPLKLHSPTRRVYPAARSVV